MTPTLAELNARWSESATQERLRHAAETAHAIDEWSRQQMADAIRRLIAQPSPPPR